MTPIHAAMRLQQCAGTVNILNVAWNFLHTGTIYSNHATVISNFHATCNLSLPHALQKKCSWHDAMTKTLDVYCVGKNAVLVWTKGPEAGKVYDIVAMPEKKGPSSKEFLDGIHQDLHALHQLKSENKLFLEEGSQIQLKLSVGLFKSYFGEPGQPGLQNFRLADPELNALLCQIERDGIVPWLQKQAASLGISYWFDLGWARF